MESSYNGVAEFIFDIISKDVLIIDGNNPMMTCMEFVVDISMNDEATDLTDHQQEKMKSGVTYKRDFHDRRYLGSFKDY
jgi:hypothetical protein